jgi:hypothetical protein
MVIKKGDIDMTNVKVVDAEALKNDIRKISKKVINEVSKKTIEEKRKPLPYKHSVRDEYDNTYCPFQSLKK